MFFDDFDLCPDIEYSYNQDTEKVKSGRRKREKKKTISFQSGNDRLHYRYLRFDGDQVFKGAFYHAQSSVISYRSKKTD